MRNGYLEILSRIEKKSALVLGTLIKTQGSTPQIPGASALFSSEGLIFGTLGGGILEAEAQRSAQKALVSKQNSFEEVNFNADINDNVGAICGGAAAFLLDANPGENVAVFKQIKTSLGKHESGVLVSVIEGINEGQVSVFRYWLLQKKEIPVVLSKKFQLEWEILKPVVETRKSTILSSRKNNLEEKGIILFAEPFFPNPELIIVGAGHIGQALCHLGHLLDFDVTILDNRPDFVTKKRLPDASRIIPGDIFEGFKKVKITDNSYIVIVTQGHREDSEALKCCVKSSAAYIGMIGSKRKIALIHEKFVKEGICSENEFNRIYAPVGIDIRSETVQEIAVSIAAQLISVRHLTQAKNEKTPVWCVVLAAGESKRMKQQKLLMPFQEKTIIETVVEKAIRSRAEKVLVVLGSDKERIEKKISHPKVITVENNNFREGMLSSIQCGINSIPEHVQALLILLGDQPMVKTEVIDNLIGTYKTREGGIIIPTFEGKRGHPILLDIKFKKEINNLDSEFGLRGLFLTHPEEIQELEINSDDILKDIDTPEDYQKELK